MADLNGVALKKLGAMVSAWAKTSLELEKLGSARDPDRMALIVGHFERSAGDLARIQVDHAGSEVARSIEAWCDSYNVALRGKVVLVRDFLERRKGMPRVSPPYGYFAAVKWLNLVFRQRSRLCLYARDVALVFPGRSPSGPYFAKIGRLYFQMKEAACAASEVGLETLKRAKPPRTIPLIVFAIVAGGSLALLSRNQSSSRTNDDSQIA